MTMITSMATAAKVRLFEDKAETKTVTLRLRCLLPVHHPKGPNLEKIQDLEIFKRA